MTFRKTLILMVFVLIAYFVVSETQAAFRRRAAIREASGAASDPKDIAVSASERAAADVRENQIRPQVKSTTSNPTTATQNSIEKLQQQINEEQNRLSQLTDELTTVQNELDPASANAQSHLQQISAQIQSIQSTLAQTESDSQDLQIQAQYYTQAQRLQSLQDQSSLQNQLQANQQTLLNLQNNLQTLLTQNYFPSNNFFVITDLTAQAKPEDIQNTRAEIQNLQIQQTQISNSIQSSELQAQSAVAEAQLQVQSENFLAHREKQNLLQELNDLQNNRQYWQTQRQALQQSLKAQRERELRTEINAQQAKIQQMESSQQ